MNEDEEMKDYHLASDLALFQGSAPTEVPQRYLRKLIGEVIRLRAESWSRDMHVDINRRTAEALGKPLGGEGSSWHDIPECVAKLRKEHEEMKEGLDAIIDAEPSDEIIRLRKVVEAAENVAKEYWPYYKKHHKPYTSIERLIDALRELDEEKG